MNSDKRWVMKRLICALAFLSCGPLLAQDRAVEPGKAAPDFTATGEDGKPFRFSEFAKERESNIVLVFSRADW